MHKPHTFFSIPSTTQLGQFCLLICGAALCGSLAWTLSVPLPFMLGSLFSTVILVSIANRHGYTLFFPRILRMLFIALIGAMIGSTISPAFFSNLPTMGTTLVAITIYVAIAHLTGYQICRRVGAYDPVTAFYSSMPGGFVEAVVLGEKGGGNVQILTLSHFIRLCAVVILVPTFFYLYLGGSVGSASGQSFETRPWEWIDLAILSGVAVIGLLTGRLLHIPAGHLLGPMILSAALFGSGTVSSSSPGWLLLLAQLIVGIGLGTHLTGGTSSTLARIALSSVLMITSYLLLSALAAFIVWKYTDLGFDALFLSFAPGGVTEMGLIALSISLSPVIVSAHHVYRIFLTVFIAALSTRWLRSDKSAHHH